MPKASAAARRRAPSRTNGPDEVADGVFVGGWKDAEKFEGARLCVLDEAPEGMAGITHVTIYDTDADRADLPNLDRVAEGVRAARARGEKVLVFCGQGVRRSPLAAAWYLHRSEGLTLDQAYERIRGVRPQIEPAAAWIGDTTNLDAE